jgi:hypothetical protein
MASFSRQFRISVLIIGGVAAMVLASIMGTLLAAREGFELDAILVWPNVLWMLLPAPGIPFPVVYWTSSVAGNALAFGAGAWIAAKALDLCAADKTLH